MSGMVGGAGSKSGIIGQTELDYEEGTWTPTGNWTNSAAGYNTYVKVGQMVTCFIYIQCTSGAGSAGYIASLPFTSHSNNRCTSTNINSGTNAANFPAHYTLTGSTTTMYVKRTDNSTGPYADNWNGTHQYLQITYKAAS